MTLVYKKDKPAKICLRRFRKNSAGPEGKCYVPDVKLSL